MQQQQSTHQQLGNMTAPQTSKQDTSILAQSSHPIALIFLYLFRSLAMGVYLLCGFLSGGYVLSTVIVVLLLSADFWTVRNVSGRVLVGLRFWNQVDEDGTSYWVFESRDPSIPSNQVDSKWAFLLFCSVHAAKAFIECSGSRYTPSVRVYFRVLAHLKKQYPAGWIVLLFVGILKFNISFIPIVILALVFNMTNAIG